MSPYDQLVKNRSLVAKTYAALMLNATTFRMFKKKQSEMIRKFLIRRIGDGSRLSRCRNWDDYTGSLAAIVRAYQREFYMSKTKRKPNFGQAAKVVNLYVKHLLMLPEYLIPYDRRRLEKHAHVPLDKQILGRMWGDRGKEGDFRCELCASGIRNLPQLKTLEKRDYIRIQRVLADADRKSDTPTIAYDYLYALREE
jgi:hypothetical protein